MWRAEGFQRQFGISRECLSLRDLRFLCHIFGLIHREGEAALNSNSLCVNKKKVNNDGKIKRDERIRSPIVAKIIVLTNKKLHIRYI